ncbi:DUF6580 family putative transport protein [Taibaiella soli]|uniref:ECF transporter S component n=1 Tax=Taibaiella soli TaxID=1649169 RepID=A0A2W2BUD5_9BACT|nr:DUF6580 family putative transport protein [Taibaiella soli]PZF71433.1 hypothetical protein DN068_19285 [Taibaiella soli]
MKRNYSNILIAAGLIFMAAATRVLNADMHLYNFAPVAALGLFSGAVIKDKRYAFLLALLGQFAADLYFQLFTNVQGFYGISQLFTYAGLISATFLGTKMGAVKPVKVLGYTLGASTLFFIVSNFGVWAEGMYGYNFAGLVKTYTMGLPFFKNTILGDLSGSVVLFGLYTLLQRSFFSKMEKATA